MAAVRVERLDKDGWPINQAVFSFGHARSHVAPTLAGLIKDWFGVAVTLGCDQDGYRCLATSPMRLSKSRYAEIIAFVNGYLAAL